VTILQGDVSEVTALGVSGAFDFVLDIGCFHGLPSGKRTRYVDEVEAHTRTGAAVMIFAFGPTVHLPGRHPTRAAEIRRRFGRSFDLTRVELGTEPPGAAWFTLTRR
jgi:hypothetical protein